MKLNNKSLAKMMAQLAIKLVPDVKDATSIHHMYMDDKFSQAFIGYGLAKGATLQQLSQMFESYDEAKMIEVVTEAEKQLGLLINKGE